MSVVSSIDTQELVSSKENIQPLRRGRDTSKLCAALHAETDSEAQHELEKQRNEFEIRLRSSNSEDPLADWCSYIHWIEQSFPKRGEEGKLNTVLQKCLKKFKDNEQYMNDIRFVKLCIKYAELEDNTVELLSQIHRHGIGVNCAELYIAWAEKYAVNNCFKKANAIYERGLKCSAQPIQLLQDAHQRFQAFLVRKMMDDKEMFQPTVLNSDQPPQRQPYNILQSVSTGSKEVIPSNRTGSTVIGPAGKLKKIVSTDQKPKSNKMISIFVDEDDVPSTEPAAKLEKIHNRKTTTKENTVKPGPWNNKKNRHVPFKVDAPSTCPFQVHVDDGEENSAVKSKNVPSSVLKSHKTKSSYEDEGFADAPLFYPEPYDPTKKPMYCKEQVYAGGLEFQFEELRAIQYRKKIQEKKAKCLKEAKLVVDMIPSTPQAIPKSPPTNKSESQAKPKSEKPKLRMLESVEKVKLTKTLESAEKVISKPLESAEKVKTKSADSTQKRKKSIFSNPIPIAVPEEQIPNTDYSMNQTIHTKEALSEMQQLWFCKPPSPVPLVAKTSKPVKGTGKSILKSSKPCFSLYVDESCLENFKASDQDKPLDLTLKLEKSDEGNSESTKPCQRDALGGLRQKVIPTTKIIGPSDNKENCFNKEVYEQNKVPFVIKVDDEDKENGVPDDYCGPVGKSNRKVSGILTPAENVEIAQLSDEEVEIDDDEDVVEGNEEDEDVPDHDFSSIIRCNTTAITETWNFTKGFQFPRGESTPNMRKSLHNKPDCDENKVLDSKPKTVQGRVLEYENRIPEVNNPTETEKSKKFDVENGENGNRNLSVIAETSREYRSSSSASSGATSTLAFRHSKNYPYTPSDVLKNSKFNLTSSQTATFYKGKSQNYTGYEASCESNQTAVKTPVAYKENAELNSTVNLIRKLNTIESASIYESSRGECDSKNISDDMNKLEIQDKKVSINDKTIVYIDPFAEEVIERLLQEVEFPKNAHTSGYFSLNDVELPPIKLGTSVTLGAFNYKVKKILGEGSYARIYALSNAVTGEAFIAKYQKPAFPWEFYIAREIQSRIKNSDSMAMFMNIESAYFFKNCSVLLTRPVEFGDLLAVIKKMQEGDMMSEMLAMHFTCQILKILETLHSCKIIHGDIKPDNFLLRHYNDKLQLQLIDFGRSIDMSLFPEGTNFTRVVTTEGLTTVEMKNGKPWTYQIDYYGAAVCGHCLLFGDYMKVVQKKGVWNISKTIPRYWAKNEWNNFFVSLINVESCSELPNLEELRKAFENILSENSEIDFGLYRLNNLLNNR